MENIVFGVALVLGAIMLLSVCYVYVKHRVLQFGGMSLAACGVILVGMSVWKNIDVSITEDGFNAKLEQAKAEAQAAKAEVQQLQKGFEVLKTQSTLRELGLYRGALDGQLSQATRDALKSFQQQKSLPQSGTLDVRTLQALKLPPIAPRQ